MRPAGGEFTHSTIAANQRRIRRLLGALDDMSGDSDPLPRYRMLAQAWSRLSEVLLVHAADLGRKDLRQAVSRVGATQMGSHRWWLAVHEIAELCGADLASGSETAWSVDP